ncbi:MAG: hypothetical protein IJQ12_10355 [Lachnospiraceae bacterium]|nr:hypothetical protein [Lachnospiraceae bacterium]
MTVLLSLTMALFLAFILALFESARLGAVKMRAECVTEIAIDSVLAEYHRELFSQYGLLMIDTSYGGAVADICNTEEHLRGYVHRNLSGTAWSSVTDTADFTHLACRQVKIPVYTRATDGNGAVLRRQILDYMTAEPVEAAMQEAAEHLQILRAEGYDTRDVEKEMDENYANLQQALNAEGVSEDEIDETVRHMHAKRSLGILTLTHPDPSAVSDASVTPASYVSLRGASRGNGELPKESLSAVELLLLDQYMMEKCGTYTSEKEGSRLKYQVEYLIAGKPGDRANLESIATTLLFWREASNFTYIMTDEDKKAFAETIAVIASILVMTPEIQDPLKLAILFAWSFAESVSDVRTLFDGGKVPLVKSKDTWRLSFAGAMLMRSGGSSGEGLSYEEYLRIMLLMTDLNDKTWRLMDLMEMDIRETQGNIHFRIDGCLDTITAHVTIEGGSGFEGTFIRTRGYTAKKEEENA